MRYIATDIDGVLTNGLLTLHEDGTETKTLCYRDIDAVGIGRVHEFEFIFVTGESGKMVERIAARYGVNLIIEGAKDKLAAIHKLCKKYSVLPDDLVYIGDSDRDAPALAFVQHSYCPSDATEAARSSAKHVLKTVGGSGVLYDVVKIECSKNGETI